MSTIFNLSSFLTLQAHLPFATYFSEMNQVIIRESFEEYF